MRRRLVAGVSIAFALALPASSALAHQGNVNFRSELDGIEPPVPGLDVQVLNYDDSLQLQNETGKTVVVDGYEGEPYVRISPDGTVEVNTRSPAYYLNDDRYGEAAGARERGRRGASPSGSSSTAPASTSGTTTGSTT